jgi:hypothetical protein
MRPGDQHWTAYNPAIVAILSLSVVLFMLSVSVILVVHSFL